MRHLPFSLRQAPCPLPLAPSRPDTATRWRASPQGNRAIRKILSRIIQVSMEERDGKMLYVPAQVEIRKGETIKFVIFNDGELEHEFVLASTERI